MAKNFNEVAQELVKQGMKKEMVKVELCNSFAKKLKLQIDKELEVLCKQEDGTFVIAKSKEIWVDNWQVIKAMLEHPKLSLATDIFQLNFSETNAFFEGVELEVLVEKVSAGDEYINPFSDLKEEKAWVAPHDTTIVHVIGFGTLPKETKERVKERAMAKKLTPSQFTQYIEQKLEKELGL